VWILLAGAGNLSKKLDKMISDQLREFWPERAGRK